MIGEISLPISDSVFMALFLFLSNLFPTKTSTEIITMYRVFIPNLNRWIENIPVTEALVYKEEGYRVERMS